MNNNTIINNRVAIYRFIVKHVKSFDTKIYGRFLNYSFSYMRMILSLLAMFLFGMIVVVVFKMWSVTRLHNCR